MTLALETQLKRSSGFNLSVDLSIATDRVTAQIGRAHV